MVALLTSVRNSPCFGGLRRTKTCHWQLFARPSNCFLVLFAEAKRTQKRFPFGNFLTSRKFAPVGATPLQGVSRFRKPRISSPQGGIAQPLRGISRRQSRQLGIFYNIVIKYSQSLNSHQRQDDSQCPVTHESALKRPDIPLLQNRPSPAETSLKTSGSPCAQD